MKRCVTVLMMLVFLCGCGNAEDEIDRAMNLREKLLASESISFDTVITADYGEDIYEFAMTCQTDAQGDFLFTVTAPETIAGISGKISRSGGLLTFDDQAVAFPLMADGHITPVTAPWVFINTLKGGYLRACDPSEDSLRLIIDDSYEEEALRLDIWLDAKDIPIGAEILWNGRRIMSLEVSNFTYLQQNGG